MPPLALTGKPIAITGASSGIGAATALACARAGMPVALLARRADRLDAVARQVADSGGRAVVVAGAVEDPASSLRLLETCADAFGSVYAAFANAGYGQNTQTVAMTDAEVRAMFDVNLHGTLHLLRPAVERFVAAGEGHALLCSSCLSKLGVPHYGCYSATKACQDHWARAMRLELAGTGVLVSSVHPLGVETEFRQAARARAGGEPSPVDLAPRRLMQSAQTVAMAIVRQLRRGRGGEVWTSTAARLGFAAADAFPSLTDALIARRMRGR